MNKRTTIVGLAIAGIVAAGAGAFALQMNEPEPKAAENSQQPAPAPVAKSETEKNFETYIGEEYDRYFLANMIAHHQGAMDMARLALTNAKHNELKEMANDIISAQTEEQNNMIAWQKAWGYPASSGDMMVDHSAMGMEDEMLLMTEQLSAKTGDEFDKAFLSSMIVHHQSAVDMSRPAAKNAARQEVKNVAKAVIEAQEAEIKQMRQWQSQWGYEN